MRIVIYELFINENNLEDETDIGDFNSLKEAKYFLECKRGIITSIANISKCIKKKGLINKKYKVFRLNI